MVYLFGCGGLGLEEADVVERFVQDLRCFYLAQVSEALAHLPDTEARLVAVVWGVVDAEAVLFVVVPPAFEFTRVRPPVHPITFPFVINELASIFISAFEFQDPHTMLQIIIPMTDIQSATGPLERSFAMHFVRFPVTLVDTPILLVLFCLEDFGDACATGTPLVLTPANKAVAKVRISGLRLV